MNPKDGKAGSAVSPAEAKDAFDADTADPGKMAELKSEQRQAKTGKYNPVKTQPHNTGGDGKAGDSESQAEKKSWIEIELIDDEKRPVPGVRYLVTLPDETIAEGTLDEKGFARIEGITPGNCRITFPDYDESCWKAASGGGASGGGGGKSGGGAGDGKSGSQSAPAGGDGKSGGKAGGSSDESSSKNSSTDSGKSGGGGESSVKGGGQEGSKGF